MLSLNQQRYADAPSQLAVYERLVSDVLPSLPGAQSVAFGGDWPLQALPQRIAVRGEMSMTIGVATVSPGYFETVGQRITAGRSFTAGDRVGAPAVAVVSRTLAERLWPQGSAVGRSLTIAQVNARPATYEVVGVVADARQAHTDGDRMDAYLSFYQSPGPTAFMYVRTNGPSARGEAELRGILARIDPDLALGAPRDLAAVLDQQRAGARLLAVLLTLFAAFAVVLALVGIYGVIASTVRQREREIAVRLAIGADRRAITLMFLRQGAIVVAIGVAAGLGAAVLLGRVLQAQLFGVDADGGLTLGSTAIAFAICGLVAAGLPARAAASVDPVMSLRD
jgi:putative ABC transport system permease protein